MQPGIDHLVIGAADLDRGRRQVEAFLGVPISPGGKHDLMGTHNCLLKLGPTAYLEVIAIDPAPPDRPRWFGLDRLETTARLAEGPRLLTWIVNGLNLAELSSNLRNRLGPWESMSRGDLQWRLTLTADGRLPAAGALPSLIEWSTDEAGAIADHPAQRLPDRGCHLQRLHLQHPEAHDIVRRFTDLGVTGLSAEASPEKGRNDDPTPLLMTEIQTPLGLRRLSRITAD